MLALAAVRMFISLHNIRGNTWLSYLIWSKHGSARFSERANMCSVILQIQPRGAVQPE